MHSKISGIPYGRHAAVPMDPATRPEHFIVRQGKIRSTREAFDEGKCLLYTEAGRYYFLIPTGKTDNDGDPVFDDYHHQAGLKRKGLRVHVHVTANVHYTLDEIYNAAGEMIQPPGDKSELKPYRVTLHEEPGDKFQIVFDCQAEDADHAAEQAEDAYPGCEVLNCIQFQEDTAGAVERPEPCVSSRKAAP